jgi:hypothetical protein
MDSDLTFNKTYGLLTKTDSEEYSTINFFKSLKYRENGYKLIKVLETIDSFEIISGFRHDSESENVSQFRMCVIKPNSEEDIWNLVDKIKESELVAVAEALEGHVVGIIVK